MADISSTIQHYQNNFQILPGIDITGSSKFLIDARAVRDNFVKNVNKLEVMFREKIENYLLLDSDLTPYVNKKMLLILIGSIFSEIQIFTNENLRDGIYEGVDWIGQNFGNDYKKWGLLTENLYKKTNDSTFKSPEWIASFAWSKMQTLRDIKQQNLLPFCVSDVGSGMDSVSSIKDMYENYGIQNFIMFDDGAYSGLQKSLAVFTHTWRELTSNPNIKTPFNIIVVIPFMTVKAVEAFRMKASTYGGGFNREYINRDNNYCQWEDTINKRNVFLWGGKVVMQNTTDIVYNKVKWMFQKIPEPCGICKNVNDFIIHEIFTDLGGTLGAALCLFEHKLPDFVSLPSVVAEIFIASPKMLNHYNKNPPYKHIDQNTRPDLRKVFDCYTMDVNGPRPMSAGRATVKKLKEKITYCKKKYNIILSKRGHKYIIHKDRKIYLNSLKLQHL